MLIKAMSRGRVPPPVDSRKRANVARRGLPAPGKTDPGVKGVWESQNVSVARRVNAVLCVGRQGLDMCWARRGRVKPPGVEGGGVRQFSLTVGRR
jgi:hypothetical protein